VAHSIKRIRTLALVGQSGAGKTTLAEALLAKAGAIPASGSVERGTTVCDYTPLEKQLQHSLKLALASFEYQEHRIHLLDTPGYPDFLGHALPAFAAVETAAIVINAQNGIEMMTGRLLTWAAKRGLDRLIVINKIDAENVDLEPLLDQMRGFLDRGYRAVKMKVGRDNPEEDVERVGAVRRLVGPEVLLMLDANQKWTAGEAIRRARMLAPFAPFWLTRPPPPPPLAAC